MSIHCPTHASPRDCPHHPANPTPDYHGELDVLNHIHNSTSHRDIPPDREPRPPTIYNFRPNRIKFRKNEDIHALKSYGNSIHQAKDVLALRIYFQNIKGLSFRTDNDDYSYVMTNLADLQADIIGLAETNTSWQHGFLRQSFSAAVRKHGSTIAKISFASPSKHIDDIPVSETFQAGGSTTIILGPWSTACFGKDIQDPTGLGRWSGIHIRGKCGNTLSVITGYRSCAGSHKTAPLGSTFHREYEFFRSNSTTTAGSTINPRLNFLRDLEGLIHKLQDEGHSIILMLDANSVLSSEIHFRDTMDRLNLTDLHRNDPAPSTYIGAEDRRIDYIFGCTRVAETLIATGTLSYLEGPQSDHRGLYVDINAISLLHHDANNNHIQPPQGRQLRSGNPEIVATYHESILQYYKAHTMVERINHLHANHQNMTRNEVRRLLETWDADQGRAMQSAENAVSRRAQRNHWSPELRNAGIVFRYWGLRLKSHKTQNDYSRLFDRLEQSARQNDPSFSLPLRDDQLSAASMSSHRKQAKRFLRECQHKSKDLRSHTYNELLLRYENDNNPETQHESTRRAKIIKNTLRAEDIRENFRRIKLAVRSNNIHNGGLQSLMLPKDTTSPTGFPEDIHGYLATTKAEEVRWETVLDRTAIEQHLLTYNKTSFRAASTSPCGHGILLDSITFTTVSPAGREFMQGLLPPEWHSSNELLREFLTSFFAPKIVTDNEPISTEVSREDVLRGFGGWRESTSTSPSGRHLGHYKALLKDDTLLDCLTKFLSIAVHHGISLSRWHQAVNIMLEKDEGQPKVNRLRIIHLFEADFNFLLKLLWGSRLVKRAAHHGLLNHGQHGSVPGKAAMELVMLQQISNDICRTQKINIIRFENDASACYDRILVHLGLMAARRCGMPENALSVHGETLQQMRYKVKTAFGISDECYHGTPSEPLFGTGQGSGASPAVWLTLVVVLMNTLERIIKERIFFTSPDTGYKHSRILDAFVDDTSIAFTDTEHTMTQEAMVRGMETAAQTWQRLLSYSGGALNFAKCSWSIIYWQWKHGRPYVRSPHPEDPTITLRLDGPTGGQAVQIRHTETNEATRVLGVYLNPAGNFTAHIAHLRNKADAFARCIRSSRITTSELLTFLKTIYTPSMLYSLPAIAAKEEDMESVQTNILAAVMNKLGASRTTPAAIRHGPTELGGLNIIDLRTEIGIAQIKFLRNATYADTEAGKLITLSVKLTQMEAGVAQNILEKPDIPLPYITKTWITSLRRFLHQHSIQITLTDTLRIRFNGKWDECIMDTSRLKGYTASQQRDLNLVRLYLHAITLSDLSNESGTDIDDQALIGHRQNGKAYLVHKWPRQEEPTPTQRRLWKRYMTSQFIRYGTKWRHSLGTVKPPSQRSPQTTAIQVLDIHMPPTTIAGCETLQQYLKHLPKWHQRLIRTFDQTATDTQIRQAFQSRRHITIASDGGLRKGIGTFGWKIVEKGRCGRGDRSLFEGSGPVDGPIDIANSTRSELGGLVAPLLICMSLASLWGLKHKCRLRWLTDSKAAISKVSFITRKSSIPFSRAPEDLDYMTAIKTLHKSLGLRFKSEWIKGHQDDHYSYDSLSTDARLNIDVDELATRHQHGKKGLPTQHTPHLAEQKFSIIINGYRYPSQIDAQLRYHINGTYLKTHLQTKRGWSDRTWEKIDMHAFGTHFKKLPTQKQVQHMKFVYGLQALGDRKGLMSRSQDEELIRCPCCRSSIETPHHFIQCTANPAREKAIQAFCTSLRKRDGCRFGQVFADIVDQWLDDHITKPHPNNCRDPTLLYDALHQDYIQMIHEAIHDQEEIGWLNLLRGFLSKTWTTVASTYFQNSRVAIQTRDDGHHRISKAVRALHILTSKLWKGRNEILHQKTLAQEVNIRTTVDSEIVALQREPDKLPIHDQHYCNIPIHDLLCKSPSFKRRWLYRVREARARFQTEARNQPRITTFLTQKSDRTRHHDTAAAPAPSAIPKKRRQTMTTQLLMTEFFRERAPNRRYPSSLPNASPPPPP